MKSTVFRGMALLLAGVATTLAISSLMLRLAVAAGPARSAPPPPPSGTFIVPAKPDSVTIDSDPGPLLGPGQPNVVDPAVKSPAERAREQYGIGLSLEESRQIQAAYFAYRNATQYDPTLREAHFRAGLLLAMSENLKEAVEAFEGELKLQPKHRGANLELGYTLSRLGRHRDAITRLQGLLRDDPQRDEHWYALGVAYVAAGQYASALQPLRKSVAMPPKRSEEHRDLGVALAALGRNSEARAEYRRALALDPREAAAWLDLANLERRVGRADSALAAYRRAEQSDSASVNAYQGQIALLASRPAERADVFRRWTRALPADADVRLQAVREFDELDRKDIALEIARDGVRHNKRSPDSHLILGIALEANGETRQALRELWVADALFRTAPDKERARRIIAGIRAGAPDSLRAVFDADSAALIIPEFVDPPPGANR